MSEKYDEAIIVVAAEAKYQQGAIAEQDIRYREALQHYERAAQINPNNSTYASKAEKMARTLED